MVYLCSLRAAVSRFARDESGAVTVDWVVGTALGISLSLAATNTVSESVMTLADRIGTRLEAVEIPNYEPTTSNS